MLERFLNWWHGRLETPRRCPAWWATVLERQRTEQHEQNCVLRAGHRGPHRRADGLEFESHATGTRALFSPWAGRSR